MKIGVTERGDAGIDLSWVDNLYDANIIITKTKMSSEFRKLVIKHKEKIILHIGVTGIGGSMYEPNVPNPVKVYNGVMKLLEKGFPVKQMVLRIDPIMPTELGINGAQFVLNLFRTTEIKRCRYSFMDMYPHVIERFNKAKIIPSYYTFHALEEMRIDAFEMLKKFEDHYNFEVCAEPNLTHRNIGCVSNKDLEILGIKYKGDAIGYQRNLCNCLGEKKELLNYKNNKQCPLGCIYCYWKD